jgi:NAD(P)-dependent dehydrogenase (short-subunit alcohol dehydrogenase family)
VESPRVLITGAARGIGAETARVLAARGARIAAVGLEPDLLAALCEELGDGHVWFEADVTDQVALDRAVAGTTNELGGLDVVIANAGIAPFGTLSRGDPDLFARAVDINLTGVIRTIRATAPSVVASRGYFLLVSSVSAFPGAPGLGAYGATKAAVESLANTLRVEVGPAGAAVGSAHPCWIDTDMVRDAELELDAFKLFRSRLPWPLKAVTPLPVCAEALADAVEKRKRKVFVPRSISLVERSRRLLNGRIGTRYLQSRTADAVALLDQEAQSKNLLGEHAREADPITGADVKAGG